MRKISVGLALMLLLLPAAPVAAATINGSVVYELSAPGRCWDVATSPRRGDLSYVAATSSCEMGGRFSPSGRRIAWNAYDREGPSRLHVAGRRGRAPRTIADDVHFWGWSDTDDRLVYAREPEEPLADGEDLWVTDAFGDEHHRVTDTPGRAEQVPSWSPDGSRIAFLADGDLYTIAPDGTDEVRLTEGAEATYAGWDAESYPEWSPDSSKIAFASVRDDPWHDDGGLALTAEIYVIPAGGGEMRNVSNLPETKDVEPQWLDDRRLIWVAGYDSDCDTNDCDADIYSARWDGSRRRVVAGARAHEWSPTVSPDGRWIAFNRTARKDRHSGVYKIRSDGSGLRKLMGVRRGRPDVDDWGRRHNR